MTDDPHRNADGTFADGNNANPNGSNGLMKGYQRYNTRLERYIQMPMDKLTEILASEDFKHYSAIERAAVFHAKRIGDDTIAEHIAERERANDRMDGKPKQTVAHGGDPNNRTPISMDGSFTLTFGTDDNDSSAKTPTD